MNAGAPGFQGAPVTKGLVLVTGLASMAVSANGAHAVPIVRGLAFRSPTQLLFGLAALYHARLVERLLGPAKYGAHACLAAALTGGSAVGLAFAALAGLAAHVPPTAHFSVAGLPLTDKVFLYAAAAQLLVVGGAGVVAPAAVGAATAALLYWRPRLASLDTPPAAQAALGRLFGPVLGGKHHSRIVVPASATAPATGGMTRRGHGTAAARGRLVEPAPGAVQQLLAMGFSADRARAALRQVGGDDVQAALAILLT